MNLKVATLAIIVGEGGSGGAIALASSNKVIMLENAIYSVISPEGCATILWRDPKKMLDAAKAMKLSAKDLLELKIIDEIIEEPIGGAHRNKELLLNNIKKSIKKNLENFKSMTNEEIYECKKKKFLDIGRSKGFVSDINSLSATESSLNYFEKIFKSNIKTIAALGLGLMILTFLIFLF